MKQSKSPSNSQPFSSSLDALEMFRISVEESPAMICRFSRPGKLRYVNRRFCQFWQRECRELLDQSLANYVHPDDQAALKKLFASLHPKMEPAQISFRALLPGGRSRESLWTVSAILLPGKKRAEYQAVGMEAPAAPSAEPTLSLSTDYQMLNKIVDSVFASLGEKYFESMVQHLTETLEADFAFVGKLDPAQDTVHIISLWGEGRIQENFSYALEGTPCQNVIDVSGLTYSSGVQELFPEDTLLQEMGIIGYSGIPLLNSRKEKIGIMAALFLRPIENAQYVQSVMQIFAARTGAELERLTFEQQLVASEENWRSLVQNIPDVVTVIDPRGKILYVNRSEPGPHQEDFSGKSIFDLICKKHQNVVRKAIQNVLSGRKSLQYETTFRRDGKEIWYSNHIGPIRRGDRIEELIIISTDITNRKQTEEALRLSEESYRGLFNNAGEAIYIQDEQGRFIDVNQGAVEMYGYPREFFIGKTPEFISAPGKNDLAGTAEMLQRAFNGEPQRFEFWGVRKNGEIFPKEVRLNPGLYFGQKVVFAFALDISERKASEEALRKEEERFRLLVENNFDLICEVSSDARYLYISPNYEEILGYTPEDLIGKNIFEYVHPDDRDYAMEKFRKQAGRLNFRYRHKSGRWVRMESTGKKYRDPSGQWRAVVISRDVTEAHYTEEVKKIMYNIATAATTTHYVEDLYQVIQQELSKIIDTRNFFIGLYDSREDSISLAYMKDENDLFETIPAANTISKLVIKRKKSLLLTEKDMEQLEQEGEIGQVGSPCKIWLGVPLIAEDEVIGIIVVQSYDDEHAYSQKDLQLLEFISNQAAISIKKKQKDEEIRHLYLSLEQSPVSVIITDTDGNIEYVNHKVMEISGYTKEELLGQNPRIFKSGQMPQLDYQKLWQTITAGETWKGDLLNRKKTGELFWESATISPIKDEHGRITHFLAIKTDITEHRQLLQQLYQAQKMEGIGRLAGGIAHDFNNLLTVINGSAEMALMRQKAQQSVHKEIVSILKAGRKAVNLTKQLLAFSRKQIHEVRIIDLNELISRLDKMLRRLIGEHITIRTRLAENLPRIKGDPTQMEQILINLVINARDAINENTNSTADKRITIETSSVLLDESHLAVRSESEPGLHVLITVSDTGVGMGEEIRSKIFEPFFTTKDRGKGTGLGLSTVYGIVKQNHGNIFVYSEPGRGSTFKIYWPVSNEQEVQPAPEPVEDRVFSGSETILVVEDDEGVREFTCNILEQLGYRVYQSCNGVEALELIRQEKLKPDLMITDMIMPEMNGRELAEKISDVLPISRILFVSGYTDDHIVQSGALEKGIHFTHKPYSVQTIAKKVREILDHRSK